MCSWFVSERDVLCFAIAVLTRAARTNSAASSTLYVPAYVYKVNNFKYINGHLRRVYQERAIQRHVRSNTSHSSTTATISYANKA